MAVRVINHGIACGIQDLGRPGYYHLGIPMSGAMDRYALRVANMLVGNDEASACLECVFIGPELKFLQDTRIAITGAEMRPKIDGKEVPSWSSIQVRKNQVLSFGILETGARCYIAIAGGIDTPAHLGSRSTYAIGALGGIEGRPVQSGDIIPIGQEHKKIREDFILAQEYRNQLETPTQLRVVPGLYWHRISETSQNNFFDDLWTVASEADRMGYRFKGGRKFDFIEREPPFGAGSDPSNITDACYPYGSIQVPSGSEPIILHRDAVSGGGYFMIGAVVSADMDYIGQLQPGKEVKFVKTNIEQALSLRAKRKELLEKTRTFINQLYC